MKANTKKDRPVLKIMLIVWVVFSILYVGYTQYKYFSIYVAQASYQKGLADAVSQVIQQAQVCKAFPITMRDQGVNLINAACLQQDGAQNGEVIGGNNVAQ